MQSKKPSCFFLVFCFFYPARVCEPKLTSIDIENLKVFSFSLSIRDNLKAGLPMYLSKAEGVSTEV